MNGYNNDIKQEQINKLKQLFPEVVTEGKIDWQKLQATLGEAVDLGERYGLGWKGKSDIFAAIQEKTIQILHLDIARERIRRASAKIRANQVDKLVSRNAPLDFGFRAYRVGDSNFKQWNEPVSNSEEIRQQVLVNLDPLEESVTDDDLLTELLLKRDVSPLAQIEWRDNFYIIPSKKLVVCLARSMTKKLFKVILTASLSSVILLDRAFGNDINLKANLLLQAEWQGVEVEVV